MEWIEKNALFLVDIIWFFILFNLFRRFIILCCVSAYVLECVLITCMLITLFWTNCSTEKDRGGNINSLGGLSIFPCPLILNPGSYTFRFQNLY